MSTDKLPKAIRGVLDKSLDPRPKKIDKQTAIAELAYFRYLERVAQNIPGTPADDWEYAARLVQV
jgi:hypothetical protein